MTTDIQSQCEKLGKEVALLTTKINESQMELKNSEVQSIRQSEVI